jgi:hypothetical protein
MTKVELRILYFTRNNLEGDPSELSEGVFDVRL